MVGHSQLEPQVLSSTDSASLQLSTSICMPFNPYRQYRIPDHLSRPRIPAQIPRKQARAQPVRATSYDAVNSPMAYKPAYYPTRAAMGSKMENVYATSPLVTTSTPDSFNMGSAYLASCQTPETAGSFDMWGQTYNFNNFNEQNGAEEDFGLGLGPLGSDLASTTSKIGESDQFPYPSLLNDVETLAFDPGSPDGQSWSSLSEASASLVSDMAEFSPEQNASVSTSELAADFDAFLRSEESTPNVAHYTSTKTNHCRAESAPRPNYRTSPYPTNEGRGRSFSTGSIAFSRAQRASTSIHNMQQRDELVSQYSSPTRVSSTLATFTGTEFDMCYQSHQSYVGEAGFGHSSSKDAAFGGNLSATQANLSPEIVNVLHSSIPSRHMCEQHFAGSTSPPDLFGPLGEEPSSPPPEDFDCEESMMPRAQDLRFEGDMYTPRYVRGHGNKREGWCGTCKPGRWLVLKNSAFWYDKSFSHGISAATGSAFEGPRESRRMKGNPDVWEGLCGSCGDWIALVSSKKKGTTWFRHAYKCHTHQKVKDTTKRRREVIQVRGAKSSTVKSESREETPFSMDAALPTLNKGDAGLH
ncbi:MAG: hypothetical protein Q9228_003506 [Teloschistes exilis]